MINNIVPITNQFVSWNEIQRQIDRKNEEARRHRLFVIEVRDCLRRSLTVLAYNPCDVPILIPIVAELENLVYDI
jgi:hypothetical protein